MIFRWGLFTPPPALILLFLSFGESSHLPPCVECEVRALVLGFAPFSAFCALSGFVETAVHSKEAGSPPPFVLPGYLLHSGQKSFFFPNGTASSWGPRFSLYQQTVFDFEIRAPADPSVFAEILFSLLQTFLVPLNTENPGVSWFLDPSEWGASLGKRPPKCGLSPLVPTFYVRSLFLLHLLNVSSLCFLNLSNLTLAVLCSVFVLFHVSPFAEGPTLLGNLNCFWRIGTFPCFGLFVPPTFRFLTFSPLMGFLFSFPPFFCAPQVTYIVCFGSTLHGPN